MPWTHKLFPRERSYGSGIPKAIQSSYRISSAFAWDLIFHGLLHRSFVNLVLRIDSILLPDETDSLRFHLVTGRVYCANLLSSIRYIPSWIKYTCMNYYFSSHAGGSFITVVAWIIGIVQVCQWDQSRDGSEHKEKPRLREQPPQRLWQPVVPPAERAASEVARQRWVLWSEHWPLRRQLTPHGPVHNKREQHLHESWSWITALLSFKGQQFRPGRKATRAQRTS